MRSILFPLLLCWTLPACALSTGGFLRVVLAKAPKAAVSIGKLTSHELRWGTKADNVLDLLDLAKAEKGMDDVRAFQLAPKFQRIANGDDLLLRCLQTNGCKPEVVADIASRSPLHAKVALRAPNLGLVQVNHEVGRISENMMTRYFSAGNWEQLEGQIGRTGIDGLFVFRKDGEIRDLLVVESKYKDSLLQQTNFGMQMSRDWILRKFQQLRIQFPDNADYAILERMVQEDNYRGILWGFEDRGRELQVTLRRLDSSGPAVEELPLPRADARTFGARELQRIRLTGSRNPFEVSMGEWYTAELAAIPR